MKYEKGQGERYLQGRTEVMGRNLSHCQSIHQEPYMDRRDIESEIPPGSNSLTYGTA
jgi:hypothetical protein